MGNDVIRVTEKLNSTQRLSCAAVGAAGAFIGAILLKAAGHCIAIGILGKDVTTFNGDFELEQKDK